MLFHHAHFHSVLALFLVSIATFSTLDFILDWPHGMSLTHMLVELGLIASSLGAALYLGYGWYRARKAADDVQQCLEKYLLGLGETINCEFQRWALTEAERCTAILLLKGLSHKDIADRCGRSERTVRQHAVAVYRKSGLAGRAELAAFFMEDLLPPVHPGDEEATPLAQPAASEHQLRAGQI